MGTGLVTGEARWTLASSFQGSLEESDGCVWLLSGDRTLRPILDLA